MGIDPISLAVGGAMVSVAYVTGLITRRRRHPKEPRSKCGCGHSLAMHDEKSNTCHAEYERETYNKSGDYIGPRQVQCKCQRYVGPIPVDHIIMEGSLPPPKG